MPTGIRSTAHDVMSDAGDNFKNSIQDAENLLQHFDYLNSLSDQPPAPELEVLKRAGLIMAMTAWETYVEDRVEEACAERLSGLADRSMAEFVKSKLFLRNLVEATERAFLSPG